VQETEFVAHRDRKLSRQTYGGVPFCLRVEIRVAGELNANLLTLNGLWAGIPSRVSTSSDVEEADLKINSTHI
jgi:hypothetical protein